VRNIYDAPLVLRIVHTPGILPITDLARSVAESAVWSRRPEPRHWGGTLEGFAAQRAPGSDTRWRLLQPPSWSSRKPLCAG